MRAALRAESPLCPLGGCEGPHMLHAFDPRCLVTLQRHVWPAVPAPADTAMASAHAGLVVPDMQRHRAAQAFAVNRWCLIVTHACLLFYVNPPTTWQFYIWSTASQRRVRSSDIGSALLHGWV